MTMLFCDRLFLLRFSLDELNASVLACSFAWPFTEMLRLMGANSKVFVAQYSGGVNRYDLCRSTWQMIYFSLALIIFSNFLGFFGRYLPFNSLSEKHSFLWLANFSFLHPLNASLLAFFLGQGKTRFAMMICVLGDSLNILFDWILIGGAGGVLPALGSKGAAIATNISLIIEISILFFAFYKSQKNTMTIFPDIKKFDFKEIKKKLQIVFPSSFSIFITYLGTAVFYKVFVSLDSQNATMISIWDTSFYFFFLFASALYEGTIILTGNTLGANKQNLAPYIIKSSFMFAIGPILIAALFLVLKSDVILNFFVSQIAVNDLEMVELNNLITNGALIKKCLFLQFIFIMFSYFQTVYEGFLTGAGDTAFQYVFSFLLIIFGSIVPAVIIYWIGHCTPVSAFTIMVIQCIINFVWFYLRYRLGRWRSCSKYF